MTTRAQLETDVALWLVRSNDPDFTGAFNAFFRRAEARLRRELRLAQQEASTTLTVTDGAAALPDDFLEARSVTRAGSGSNLLEYVTPEVFREQGFANATRLNAYTIEGPALTLRVSANASGDITVVYFAAFPALTNPGDSNWLTTNAYDMVMNLLLYEAANFIQDDERKRVFFAEYAEARDQLVEQDAQARTSGSASVMVGRVHGV